MITYEETAVRQMQAWRKRMMRKPGLTGRISKKIQGRINEAIPDKIHDTVTRILKEMVRGILAGVQVTTGPVVTHTDLASRESMARERIEFYKRAAAAEGGVTGFGGILAGLADFPLLIGFKMKLLFELSSIYGYNTQLFRERLYILYIFQLTFSSQQHRRLVFEQIDHWNEKQDELPQDIHGFDWRTFQIEYRDYIDLAKLAQLIPGIGAVVGLVVNYRLLDQLGEYAMNAYRLRWFREQKMLI